MVRFTNRRARTSYLQAIRCELLGTAGTCWTCGTQLIYAHWATLDHLTPLSRGGSDDPENLRLSCLRCNRRRGNRLLEEFCVVQLRKGAGMFAIDDAQRKGLVATDPHFP